MKTKRRIGVIVILTAILIALALFAKLWAQSFIDFANLDQATQLYIHSARNIEEDIPQAILENQEFQPLVDVLGNATVRFDGRSRLLKWDMEDNMYDMYFRHFENSEPVLDADVSLCSDGMMYVHLGEWFGYLRYRLENCDIDAVATVLDDLLAIDQKEEPLTGVPSDGDSIDPISAVGGEAVSNIPLDFYINLFEQEAMDLPDAYPRLAATSLSTLAGKTYGTVADTDELLIEVVDSLSSGFDAKVALRVTAKQMDTVLRDDKESALLDNYRFGHDTDGTLFQEMESASTRYIYSDADNDLAPNQFYYLVDIRAYEGFNKSPYSIRLGSLGYYDSANASNGSIPVTKTYPGPWEFEVEFGSDTEYSRVFQVNQPVYFNGESYTVDTVYLSPFGCSVVIYGEADGKDYSPDVLGDSPIVLYTEGVQVTTGRGGMEARSQGSVSGAIYYIDMGFEAPIDIEQIAEINVLGQDFKISGETAVAVSHGYEPTHAVE